MGMGCSWLKWVGHLGLKWVGYLWLEGWDIYGSNGWGSYGKVSYCLERYPRKTLVFRGVPFPVIALPRVFVPLNSRPVAYYSKGGTTPRLITVQFNVVGAFLT